MAEEKYIYISNPLKVLEPNLIFLFLMEKSILYAKVTVSQKKFVSKLSFKYYIGLLFS